VPLIRSDFFCLLATHLWLLYFENSKILKVNAAKREHLNSISGIQKKKASQSKIHRLTHISVSRDSHAATDGYG